MWQMIENDVNENQNKDGHGSLKVTKHQQKNMFYSNVSAQNSFNRAESWHFSSFDCVISCMTRRFVLVVLMLNVVAAGAELQDCTIPGVQGHAQCGQIRVAENGSQPGGRLVSLKVTELQADTQPKRPDPIFVLQGGPGQPVTQLASYYGRVFAALRRNRDIVLVDIRGTGESDGLYCNIYANSSDRIDQLFPSEAIRACREELARRADLTQYHTGVFIQDIIDVLNSLHIRDINVYATSYGTRLAFELVRSHPDRVRTMTLKGVVPPGFLMTEEYSRDAYNTLLKVTSPGQRQQLDELLKRGTIRIGKVQLSPGVFSEAVRTMLYTPDSARQLPNAINRTLSGDSSGFARAPAEIRQTWQRALAIGVFFSVTCSEDIPFVNEPERPAISSRTLGEFRRREQMEACQDWPRAKITENFGKPFRTAVPTLLFSGALDPVTPPNAGDEALKFLSKGRHFVLPENGHPMGERAACIAETMEAFLETRSVQDVANHCTGSQQ